MSIAFKIKAQDGFVQPEGKSDSSSATSLYWSLLALRERPKQSTLLTLVASKSEQADLPKFSSETM